MKTAAKIVAGIAIVFVALLIISPTVAWDGGALATIHVRVIDDESESPINGAEVYFPNRGEAQVLKLTNAEDRRLLIEHSQGYGRTDKSGTCIVKKMCGAGGGNFLFWRTGRVRIDGPISISSPGYEKVEGLIQNFIGEKHFSLRKREKFLTIYLKKKEPNQSPETTTMAVTPAASHPSRQP